MAAYREHISVSSLLGIVVGGGSYFALGFTPIQGALVGWLTAMGGMLPDLDSETGRPVREMFGLVAAIAPLALVGRVLGWLGLQGTPEMVMLLIVVMYLAIKYGGQMLVGSVSVHRGMFHSIPAMIIAAELTYLVYPHDSPKVKLLMGTGVAIGFFSHLLLDEMYSVQWSGVRIKLKKSAGSAIKMFGRMFVPNVVTYSLLAVLSWAVLVDVGIIQPTDPEPLFQQAEQIDLGPSGTSDARPHAVAEAPADSFSLQTGEMGETDLGVPTPVADPFAPSPVPERFVAPVDATPVPPERTAGGLVLPEVDPDPFGAVPR
jgi:membrane-bound metal-dependent hydrolase YbcI (DUF457 family)